MRRRPNLEKWALSGLAQLGGARLETRDRKFLPLSAELRSKAVRQLKTSSKLAPEEVQLNLQNGHFFRPEKIHTFGTERTVKYLLLRDKNCEKKV